MGKISIGTLLFVDSIKDENDKYKVIKVDKAGAKVGVIHINSGNTYDGIMIGIFSGIRRIDNWRKVIE